MSTEVFGTVFIKNSMFSNFQNWCRPPQLPPATPSHPQFPSFSFISRTHAPTKLTPVRYSRRGAANSEAGADEKNKIRLGLFSSRRVFEARKNHSVHAKAATTTTRRWEGSVKIIASFTFAPGLCLSTPLPFSLSAQLTHANQQPSCGTSMWRWLLLLRASEWNRMDFGTIRRSKKWKNNDGNQQIVRVLRYDIVATGPE